MPDESHGVRELVTALFREIYFAAFWDGINSVIKGGNKLPQSKCEFHNSQKRDLEITGRYACIIQDKIFYRITDKDVIHDGY